jgi:hypothetical protein
MKACPVTFPPTRISRQCEQCNSAVVNLFIPPAGTATIIRIQNPKLVVSKLVLSAIEGVESI